jgi:hypothetical protein
MKRYHFTVLIADLPEMTDEAANRLYEAGCDDATAGSSQGVSHVAFHREAETLEDAIRSGIDSIHRAGFQATRVEIEDFDESNQISVTQS